MKTCVNISKHLISTYLCFLLKIHVLQYLESFEIKMDIYMKFVPIVLSTKYYLSLAKIS